MFDTMLICMRCDNPVMSIKGEFKLQLDEQYGLYCGDCKGLINTQGGRLMRRPERRSFIKNVK
jgi:hypothetical protein